MRVRTALAAGAALTGLVTSSALAAGGLPSAPTGHRPGPDALYQAPPRAPQLENTGVWKADPVLVAGGASYRQGEWVYQDFLLDDHGATGIKDPNDENGPSAHLFSPAGGTFTYPTDPVYAGNAADLVELRVRPLRDATAFRVTLNTLKDPSRTAFT
ncbi:MAG: glucodextranase DOMON-like domain-containing protein, partial [Mycobacteriales bacterium]